MTILIVDDEPQIRSGLRDGLPWNDLGFNQVLTAEEGNQALELYRQHRPGIVVTDVRMPGMDGLQLAQQIRALSEDTRIIMVSGHSDFEYAKRALQLEVTDYLLKPVKRKELIELIVSCREQYKERMGRLVPQANLPTSVTVVRALEFVRDHLAEDLSLERVAASVQKSPNYFSHLFKKETGMAFSEYWNRARIKEAKALMATTTLLCYEVAEQVGYRDYKYFVEVFHKLEGCAPSEYRRGPDGPRQRGV